ncbi:YbaK/EbsC family protein [Vibrio sp. ZSDE26]|uniref:YbaK/EbsC family protein n=1 Tax=Vibrio amylolyticus TaxID=2847292 RepID=A0A9X1XL12_9VIBR|nr:YbaK/EbsC family protein [Vibrio amylolyticus]MCK6264749.1 YbaK/EbsC family protein [Vibrio amylolyticus]
MSKLPSTSVIQYLDEQQIHYRLLPQEKATVTIEETAKQRGIRPEQMVKSIVLRDMGNQYALACVPGDRNVDPKKVRALLNCRRMTCVSLDDVFSITGYKPGSVTPLQITTPMPVVFDTQLFNETEVTISSGDAQLGIALRCEDLRTLCQPIIASICRTN